MTQPEHMTLVGRKLLYDLSVVAGGVHLVNILSIVLVGDWNGFAAYEVLSGASTAAVLLFWRFVEEPRRGAFLGLVGLTCVARWTLSWMFGDPHTVYTSTVSMILYLPFLLAVAVLLGHKAKWLIALGAWVAVVGALGAFREEVAPGPLGEWRIGPSSLAGCVLLLSFFARWRQHFDEMEASLQRESRLSVALQASTARHLGQQMESVTRISGALAHELNNLLAVVQPLSLTLSEELSGEQAVDARDIYASSARARDLGEKFLLLTKMHGGASGHVDLASVVREHADFFRSLVPQRLILEVDSLSLLVEVPAKELVLVIEQLLRNSSEASGPETSIILRVEHRDTEARSSSRTELGTRSERSVVVSVTDQGGGIPAEVLSEVFDPYISTHSDPSRGLGLTTVYAVSIRAGGSVRVARTGIEGTTVVVELPVSPTNRADSSSTSVGQERDAVALSSPPELLAVGGMDFAEGRQLRVLLVDDEPMVLRATQRILERQGCTVVAYLEAKEALAELNRYSLPFDIVVTDVRMPGMSGPEFHSAAKEEVADPPPFLFLTGYIDERAPELVGVPSSRVLHKPFNPAALHVEVRRVVVAHQVLKREAASLAPR